MNPFLHGFTSELTKLAQGEAWQSLGTAAGQQPKPATGVVRPPSTGTPGAPKPRPVNAFKPTGDFSAAIPTQKLESPAAAAPTTWRPSPGYRPKPSSDPAPPPVAQKKRGGGGGGPATGDVPWETAQQRVGRQQHESRYNANLRAEKFKPRSTSSSGAGYRRDSGFTASFGGRKDWEPKE